MEEILLILQNNDFSIEDTKKIIKLCKKKVNDKRNERSSNLLKTHIKSYFDDIKNNEVLCNEIYKNINTFNKAKLVYDKLIDELKITKMKIKQADYYVETILEISFEKFKITRYYTGDNEGEGQIYYRGIANNTYYYMG